MRILSWNIGYEIDYKSSWETELSKRNMQIVEILNRYNPDIVLLQEVSFHEESKYSQAIEIAKESNYSFEKSLVLSKSHHIKNCNLDIGISILSKFPIVDTEAKIVFNPNIKIVRPNNEIWSSHQKGILNCRIKHEVGILNIFNLHLLPIQLFNILPDNKKIKEVWNSIEKYFRLKIDKRTIIGGDFNNPKTEDHVPVLKMLSKSQSYNFTTKNKGNVDYFYNNFTPDNHELIVIKDENEFDHHAVILNLNISNYGPNKRSGNNK